MSTCLACNDRGEVAYEENWPDVRVGPCPHILQQEQPATKGE